MTFKAKVALCFVPPWLVLVSIPGLRQRRRERLRGKGLPSRHIPHKESKIGEEENNMQAFANVKSSLPPGSKPERSSNRSIDIRGLPGETPRPCT